MPSLREKTLRNFVASSFANGNRISQQHFMLEDLAYYDDGITNVAIDQALRALSGNGSEGR